MTAAAAAAVVFSFAVRMYSTRMYVEDIFSVCFFVFINNERRGKKHRLPAQNKSGGGPTYCTSSARTFLLGRLLHACMVYIRMCVPRIVAGFILPQAVDLATSSAKDKGFASVQGRDKILPSCLDNAVF